jgi:uncharacterized glyoxalase superfamily protein PhnB
MSGKNPVPRKKATSSAGKKPKAPASKKAMAPASKQTLRAEPESFRGRELGTALTVNDLQKSLQWYRDVMKFTVDRTIERDGKVLGYGLKAGTVQIFINQDDFAKGQREKGLGMSFQITTIQDIDALANGIKSRGGTLVMEPADMPWGARVFRVRDPDGFGYVITTPRNG